MNTPPRQVAHTADAGRKYTAKEKQQLIDNLDIEIADRTRRFRDTLNDVLTRFKNHQEALILRLPKSVRSITMAEFGDKYNGDVEACLRGCRRKNQEDEPENITAAVRKRKWHESQDESTPARAHKTARNATPSPTKPKTPARFPLKTPGRQLLHDLGKRLMPSSPRHQLTRFPSINRKSPQKPLHPLSNAIRPPSSAFDPNLPKTPAYPRAAKRNEPLMSANGSPLENPLNPPDGEAGVLAHGRGHTVRKRASSILVKRTAPPTAVQGTTNAQEKGTPAVHTQGFISVTTKDGHVLEFDPFTTAPAEIDALEGVSESAKQAAKDDVVRFISSQMAKWTIS